MYPEELEIETHPFEPFIDAETKVLIMGTFPPPRARWSMDFYYPNRINDFWYMMGLIFYGDRYALFNSKEKKFDLEKIKSLLRKNHIGLNDTGYRIRRLQNNASDKFLDIIEPIHLYELLEKYPRCRTLCTTGEKAASIIAELTDTPKPAMGQMETSSDGLEIWRMPSTSRAFPMKLEDKAAYYSKMFAHLGII